MVAGKVIPPCPTDERGGGRGGGGRGGQGAARSAAAALVATGRDVTAPIEHRWLASTTRTNHAWVLEQAARGRLPLDRLVADVLPPVATGDPLERLANRETRLVGVVFDRGTATE